MLHPFILQRLLSPFQCHNDILHSLVTMLSLHIPFSKSQRDTEWFLWNHVCALGLGFMAHLTRDVCCDLGWSNFLPCECQLVRARDIGH